MKTNKIIWLMAALTLAWGCSSDDEEANISSKVIQEEEAAPQWNGSTFVASDRPSWAIDWSANDAAPNWQEPEATHYECSMQLFIEQDEQLSALSSDNDVMAMFINGECRGVSYRNVLTNGQVAYVLHVKGSSEETNADMELRYYNDQMHQLFIDPFMPPFSPNNLMEEAHHIVQSIGDGSTKYPVSAMLTVILPKDLPFTPTEQDILAVFVGDECRGFGLEDPEMYPGWRANVFCRTVGETVQLRYYSADKGGVYTILQTVALNDELQQVDITF